MLKVIALIFIFLSACVFAQPSVVFLNPGKPTENFWAHVDLFALAAAQRLDLKLTIFHAKRDQYSMIKYLEKMIQQQQLPDYLMLVNEKQSLPRMLHLLEDQPVYVLILLNDLEAVQRSKYALNTHWQQYIISRLVPNNYWIGEQTAKAMYQQAGGQPGGVVLISGDRATPASKEREAGALSFFHQQTNLSVKPVIYGDWEQARSYQQSKSLLRRYPQLKYIWTANDHMAFGSLQAIQDIGKSAGKDIFLSSVNVSLEALKLREQGQLSALGGGHFMAAGWGLRLIHLHYLGYALPSNVTLPMFRLVQPNTEFYQQLKAQDWSGIAFERLFLDEHNKLTLEFVH
ncbi:ABC transporter substrate-binding protein [Agarivorans sp. QJM3NY_33]|uniref:ABC transporter substrate-binding protein n=1 Tax=Agarivorans sp. QJM3NY_33 TaxID=3421432 RepID=UPI003D7C693F